MIFDKLCELVAEQSDVTPEEVPMETTLGNDYNADSIDIVELMMAVEEEFHLGEVEENALENIKTIGDVVEYIQARVHED